MHAAVDLKIGFETAVQSLEQRVDVHVQRSGGRRDIGAVDVVGAEGANEIGATSLVVVKERAERRAEREQRGAASGGPRGAGEWGRASREGTVSCGLRDGGRRGGGRAGRRGGAGAGQEF